MRDGREHQSDPEANPKVLPKPNPWLGDGREHQSDPEANPKVLPEANKWVGDSGVPFYIDTEVKYLDQEEKLDIEYFKQMYDAGLTELYATNGDSWDILAKKKEAQEAMLKRDLEIKKALDWAIDQILDRSENQPGQLFNILKAFLAKPTTQEKFADVDKAVDSSLSQMLSNDGLGGHGIEKELRFRRKIITEGNDYLIAKAINDRIKPAEGSEYYKYNSDAKYNTLVDKIKGNPDLLPEKLIKDRLSKFKDSVEQTDSIIDDNISSLLRVIGRGVVDVDLNSISQVIRHSDEVKRAISDTEALILELKIDAKDYQSYVETYIRDEVASQLASKTNDSENTDYDPSKPHAKLDGAYKNLILGIKNGKFSEQEQQAIFKAISEIKELIRRNIAEAIATKGRETLDKEEAMAALSKSIIEGFAINNKIRALNSEITHDQELFLGYIYAYIKPYIVDETRNQLVNGFTENNTTGTDNPPQNPDTADDSSSTTPEPKTKVDGIGDAKVVTKDPVERERDLKRFPRLKKYLDNKREELRERISRSKLVGGVAGGLVIMSAILAVCATNSDNDNGSRNRHPEEQVASSTSSSGPEQQIKTINTVDDFNRWYTSLSPDDQLKAQNFFNLWSELDSSNIGPERAQEISETLKNLGVDSESIKAFLNNRQG